MQDSMRLSAVIRYFFEWFFTEAEVEQYAQWIDLLTVLGTLFVAASFCRLLFGPFFGRRRK